jgi:hypothetical protein
MPTWLKAFAVLKPTHRRATTRKTLLSLPILRSRATGDLDGGLRSDDSSYRCGEEIVSRRRGSWRSSTRVERAQYASITLMSLYRRDTETAFDRCGHAEGMVGKVEDSESVWADGFRGRGLVAEHENASGAGIQQNIQPPTGC